MTNRLFRSPVSKVSNGHIYSMLNKVLPVPYREYTEPDITFDCINSGLDPVVGISGMIEACTNASEHSSFERASYETHKIFNRQNSNGVSYTSDGKIAFVQTEENWLKWNPTGTPTWKSQIDKDSEATKCNRNEVDY